MNKLRIIFTAAGAAILLVLVGNPLFVAADSAADAGAGPAAPYESIGLAPVIIGEVQPGDGKSANNEFIELFNTSREAAVDFSAHNWRLEVAASTATSWQSPLRTIHLSGTMPPFSRYVLTSEYTSGGQTFDYTPDNMVGSVAAHFSPGLSTKAGHIRLLYDQYEQPDSACVLTTRVVDEMEWANSTTTASLDGRHMYYVPSAGLSPAMSIQRYRSPATSIDLDTDNDVNDFTADTPSPGWWTANTATADHFTYNAPVPGLPVDACDPNAVSLPPVSPTDPIAPSDPSPSPTSGSDGDSAAAGGGTPPDDANGQADDPAAAASSQPHVQPSITELLPNPAAPQTDADDEFIELYNPNAEPFDLTGYTLRTGETTTHDFVLPPGTILTAASYQAFYSRDTGLSLANSGGKAQLVAPDGTVVAQTDAYGTAAEGMAWALVGGRWAWTTALTPGASNILAAPAAPPKAATKKTTAPIATVAKAPKPKAAVKAASTKQPKAAKPNKTTVQPISAHLPAATSLPQRIMHPGVLASIGVLAVLYGAYEYRHDIAGKFHQLRSYRAARQARRQSTTRR